MQSEMDFKPDYASDEELMFSWYVSELLEGGWLESATYQPEAFILTEDVMASVMVEKKNCNELREVKLLNGNKYTADWYLRWNRKSEGVFYWLGMGVYPQGFFPYSKPRSEHYLPFKADIDEYGNIFSIVDVKGAAVGKNNNSAITFPLNSKMLYDKEGLFVQKIVISLKDKSLFARSFTPINVITTKVYVKNCKYGKKGESKLKYTPRILQHWLKIKDGRNS